MPPLARSILVVLGAVMVAGLVVALVEAAASAMFPPPPGAAFGTPGFDVALVPLGGKLGVLLAWTLGPLAGGYVAARWAPRSPLAHALIVGAVFTLADALNLYLYPSPIWMTILGLLVPIPAAWLGARLAARPVAAVA